MDEKVDLDPLKAFFLTESGLLPVLVWHDSMFETKKCTGLQSISAWMRWITDISDEGGVDERRDGVGGEREGGGQSDAEDVQPDRIQSKPSLHPAPLVPLSVLGLPRRSCFLLDHGSLLPATSRRPTAAAALCEAAVKGDAAEP